MKVVSPSQYDDTILWSKRSPPDPPGPDWTYRLVFEEEVNHIHWISPIRHIEFTRRTQSSQFEELRKLHDNDEVLAWNEFRSIKNVRDVKVGSPAQYDDTTLQLKENPRASPRLDRTSRVKSPRPGDEDKSDNRFKRKRTVGHRRQGMSLPLPLDPSNNNKDDDNVDGGLTSQIRNHRRIDDAARRCEIQR